MPNVDLISGGFYITLTFSRPVGLGETILPERIVTLSECFNDSLLGAWALGWTTYTRAERLTALEKFGLPPDALPSLLQSITDSFGEGEIGWPCVWQSPASARAALARLRDSVNELFVVELGVPAEAAALLVRERAVRPGEGECGLLTRLQASCAIEPGSSLGWEVLGSEVGGSFHSWLCNSIQDAAFNNLGIKPGPLGLLVEETDAIAVIKMIEDGLGAEPVPWFRGVLSQIA